jgi:hypothetical protein
LEEKGRERRGEDEGERGDERGWRKGDGEERNKKGQERIETRQGRGDRGEARGKRGEKRGRENMSIAGPCHPRGATLKERCTSASAAAPVPAESQT